MQLRAVATASLKDGTTPPAHTGGTSAEMLALLYRLASDPARAGDALKVLHELQVHQVELDMQHEQLEQNQRELSMMLSRYAEFYEFAPLGYFVVDADYTIIEANPAGAELLGIERTALGGRHIESLLRLESRQTLRALLVRLRHNDTASAQMRCEVQTIDNGTGSRPLQVAASLRSGGLPFLIILMEKLV